MLDWIEVAGVVVRAIWRLPLVGYQTMRLYARLAITWNLQPDYSIKDVPDRMRDFSERAMGTPLWPDVKRADFLWDELAFEVTRPRTALAFRRIERIARKAPLKAGFPEEMRQKTLSKIEDARRAMIQPRKGHS